MLTKAGTEQRRFPRTPFQRPVRFKPKDGAIFLSHSAQDISQGGIRVNSDGFVPLGTILTLQIKLADEGILLDMRGKVVWVKYVPHLDMYQLGLEFFGDSSYGRWKIAHHIVKTK
ncbi:MAG: PilZ domain-containing protein [Candidatus Omnitrophica bacterium]|nr:PilZ domain-containing protein [Candidatus Omnitrophota bacterium]